MAFFDMFDKLDDIVYEPVKVVCSWMTEPLKGFENKRNEGNLKRAAEIELVKKDKETELEIRKNSYLAQLETEQKKWDADIEHLKGMQEIERNKKIVDAIVEYRRSMIEDAKDIADSLSHMEMSLLAEANDLALHKMEQYKQIQEKAMKQCDDELLEIGKRFANNERIRVRREDMVLAQTEDIINAAKNFIAELNDDIKRINTNNTNRVDRATAAAEDILRKMGNTLSIGPVVNAGLIE